MDAEYHAGLYKNDFTNAGIGAQGQKMIDEAGRHCSCISDSDDRLCCFNPALGTDECAGYGQGPG